MDERQRLGVECDSLVRPIHMAGSFRSVAWIADHGMSRLSEVDADLISPSGL
jgi:hypothetical protein